MSEIIKNADPLKTADQTIVKVRDHLTKIADALDLVGNREFANTLRYWGFHLDESRKLIAEASKERSSHESVDPFAVP